MARLDFIRFSRYRIEAGFDHVTTSPCTEIHRGRQIPQEVDGLPQFYWKSGLPWNEANLWAVDQAMRVLSRELKLRTVQTIAVSIHAYMKFLEETDINWWHFPAEKADRCLVRFRGELVRARDAGAIAASTASARMSALIQFYRWVQVRKILSPDWPPFEERIVGIRLTDDFGFRRTLFVRSSDLAIPNRRARQIILEDGLLPVSLAERDQLLDLAAAHASVEFHLMLWLGFATGMRLGSICDLKIKTLTQAQRHHDTDALRYLTIGPGVRDAPVHTKFGITGQVIIPTVLLERLIEYVDLPRRLSREALASTENKNLLFLTRFGRPYARRGSNGSSAVNVDICRLKEAARRASLDFDHFKFHRSRATFATSIADTAISIGGAAVAGNVVGLIRSLLMHKHETTSMQYISFVQSQKTKARWANEFTRLFVGERSIPVAATS